MLHFKCLMLLQKCKVRSSNNIHTFNSTAMFLQCCKNRLLDWLIIYDIIKLTSPASSLLRMQEHWVLISLWTVPIRFCLSTHFHNAIFANLNTRSIFMFFIEDTKLLLHWKLNAYSCKLYSLEFYYMFTECQIFQIKVVDSNEIYIVSYA